VSFLINYNGALVVKTPFDASFSFGFIGLSSQQQNANTLNTKEDLEKYIEENFAFK
jgi:hypothetical protein